MERQSKILRCMPKIMIGGGSVDYDLHVLTLKAEVIPQYEFMCAAVDEAHDIEVLKVWLAAIEKIEAGVEKEIEKSTEGWVFVLSPNSVLFAGEFDQGTGGKVSLAQFKLAVQTYLRFLQDPERKPNEVVFPD